MDSAVCLLIECLPGEYPRLPGVLQCPCLLVQDERFHSATHDQIVASYLHWPISVLLAFHLGAPPENARRAVTCDDVAMLCNIVDILAMRQRRHNWDLDFIDDPEGTHFR